MNQTQQKDLDTIMEVANVEFNTTDNTCTVMVPLKVPKILESVLLRLRAEDTPLLSHLMGEAFLKIIRTQLHQQTEGGERFHGEDEEGGTRLTDSRASKSI